MTIWAYITGIRSNEALDSPYVQQSVVWLACYFPPISKDPMNSAGFPIIPQNSRSNGVNPRSGMTQI